MKTLRFIPKALVLTGVIVQLAAFGVRGAAYYQIDTGSVSTAANASDGTEPLDNWFGNEFTALAGANLINRVDVGIFTVAPSTTAQIAIYRIGNPTVGPTRIYTQTFTPVPGNGSTVNLNQIPLTTPVLLDPGDLFLVSVMIRNVIGLPPNDVYPFAIDTSTTSTGSFWDRSAPNTFNLDDLSNSRRLDYALPPDGSGFPSFIPGGRVIIRANGITVPEPSTFALAGLGAAALLIFRRRNQ